MRQLTHPARHMGLTCLTLIAAITLLLPSPVTGTAQDAGNLQRIEYQTVDGTTSFRRLVNRQESGNRTLETWITEGASINGGYGALSQIEEETVRISETTTQVTRQEFVTDQDGRRVLLERVDEERVEGPGGALNVVRSISQLDANGRPLETRRETETTTMGPNGAFETETQILRPALNRSGFLPTEQVIETGRSDGEGRVLESDRTSYSDPTQSGNWVALERRITTHDYSNQEVATVENVYRQNANGELALNEQFVAREWTDSSGREQLTQDVYSSDIPGQRSLRQPELLRQVSSTRTETPDGGWEFVREVRESRQGRFRIVERERETARANGGRIDLERVLEMLDANGRLEPIESTTFSETQ